MHKVAAFVVVPALVVGTIAFLAGQRAEAVVTPAPAEQGAVAERNEKAGRGERSDKAERTDRSPKAAGPAQSASGHADPTPGAALTPAAPVFAATPPTGAAAMLRCWQYGRLILEEPVGANTVTAPGVALQVRGRADARGVQLLDLRNATCLIR